MPAHPDTYARFFMHPQPQGDSANVTGHKDVLYIEVHVKGSKNTSSSRPATEQDKVNYPRAWKAYETNSSDALDGTPIACLNLGPSQVLDLNALGFFTVEELAEAGEAVIANVKGGQLFQKRAKAYLKAMAEVAADEAAAKPDAKETGTAGPAKTSKQKKTGTE
jgi:hypothetical protein